jgi:hypothetical protein
VKDGFERSGHLPKPSWRRDIATAEACLWQRGRTAPRCRA